MLTLVVTAIAACRTPAVAPETARAFDRARSFRAELVARASAAPVTPGDSSALIALGYLERARLGLGSPFRLVDFALNDRRLQIAHRDSTAWALLTMVYDGDVYQVEPAALESLFVHDAANGAGSGAAHVQRLEQLVLGAKDARAGELAARMAFALAHTERVVRATAPITVARAAAQLRDRALARDDLLRLLRAARAEQRDPLQLLPSWRMGRRFLVERPVLETGSPAQETAAVAAAPALLADLRRAGSALVDPDEQTAPVAGQPDPARLAPLLSPAAGAALAALPQVRAMPPQAPVVVAIAAAGSRLGTERGIAPALSQARQRFRAKATGEETLAAEFARLDGRGGGGGRVAGAVLWAATAMRTYAQEEPWFPSSGGPSVADLKARFGIAAVSFDREVPPEWRPYYRRLLASAVGDLYHVLPALRLDGIGIHFGRQPLEHALAVHDPRTRTVFLPLGTGAGAIAHELAHDLDWQTSARQFARRGEYSTDQAVREQRGTLARSLRGLTSAALVAPGPENHFRPPHAQRPTEVFASSVDWYVAAALAREGRMNGYLSAVQDEVLTGFASVRPPDAHGAAGDATIEVLGAMTALPADTRAWFLARFGRGRDFTAQDRVDRVLEITAAAGGARALLPPPAAVGFGMLPPGARCVARQSERDDPVRAARRRAVELAAESVARRLLAEQGVLLPGGIVVPVDAAGRTAAPHDPRLAERELIRLRDVILDRVQRLEESRSWLPAEVMYRAYC